MAGSEAVTDTASTVPSPASETSGQPWGEEERPPLETGSRSSSNADEGDLQDARSVRTATSDLPSRGPPRFVTRRRELGLSITNQGWSGSTFDFYDVITVHGIRDNYRWAWIDETGSWAVKDTLFKKFSVREIDYSYEVDETSLLYEQNGLRLHAERLITKYAEVREPSKHNPAYTDGYRPVIWVCHDLGGTIVKEALSLAQRNPDKYGKIAFLTTAIIFMGTPHRFESQDLLEDQLHKLLCLPGPLIKDNVIGKVKNLARQVDSINSHFLETKMLDRASVFNLFTHNTLDSWGKTPINDISAEGDDLRGRYDIPSPLTPFRRYVHFIGHSFEAAGRISRRDTDHAALVRGAASWDSLNKKFGTIGWPLEVNHYIMEAQARLWALAPPTRLLETSFDPVLPMPPIPKWLGRQMAYTEFFKQGSPKVMHLHGDGNPAIDISEVSRTLHAICDSGFTPRWGPKSLLKSLIYFEFDQRDSRFNTVSSLLTYLVSVLAWKFWSIPTTTIGQEMQFLMNTHAWSDQDLFHLLSIFDHGFTEIDQPTIFIGCFDQCPEDQRRWFLERVLERQSRSDRGSSVILSTSTRDGLAVDSFPEDARINLNDCPAIRELSIEVSKEFRLELAGLLARRPIYTDFQPQLESLMKESEDAPYLGRILLAWLGNHHHGKPKSDIADKIKRLSPLTAKTVVDVFVSSVVPSLQTRARNVFHWVKYASEPWSPESLVEALAVCEFHDEEPCFSDLDVEDTMAELEQALGGIVVVKGRDVKFSHPAFYEVPDLGIEDSPEEQAAAINGTLAEVCLRYIQLESAKEALAELSPEKLEGGPWETLLDAVFISHPRTSLAEYAVRFWPQHYKASGQFKPKNLVRALFASKEARASWEIPFWLLSNPLTRMQRSYVSTLPVFAKLGLEDLVDEEIQATAGQPSFQKDCWLAITEAARAGNRQLVHQLLQRVTVDEDELQTALLWAAGNGDTDILDALIKRIPELKTFQWPENIMARAAATGLDNVLTALLLSDHDVNEASNSYDLPPAGIAAWRGCVSAMEILINSDPKPELEYRYQGGPLLPLIHFAIRGRRPEIVEILVKAGADPNAKEAPLNDRPVMTAIKSAQHQALDILIKAGADFTSGAVDSDAAYYLRPPIIVAANENHRECVRVLLKAGADPNTSCADGSALYCAVFVGAGDVVRLLLENDPKALVDVIPEDGQPLMTHAVQSGNLDVVSLLIENGLEVDFVDPLASRCKTPLSLACYEGNLEMAKLLVKNGADINYTGGSSEAPLFTALFQEYTGVAKYLLQNEKVDVMWKASDGLGSLHAAIDNCGMLSDLLKRGLDIDDHSAEGTPLHMAARSNYPQSMKVLLAHDPRPDLEYAYSGEAFPEEEQCTALHLACMQYAPECVELLLAAGASVKACNKKGHDAVDILIREGAQVSGTGRSQECLNLLLHRLPLDNVDRHGRTRLHGIQKNTLLSTVQLLVDAQAPFDKQDKDGYTPLAVAVEAGNGIVAQFLIRKGARVNITGPAFGSILHLAVSKGSLRLVKHLIAAGADCEMVDPEYGESLLYTALGIFEEQVLQQMVRYLVEEVKVPMNKLGGEYGYPIIRAVVMRGSVSGDAARAEVLKLLIRHGAQLDVADSQGRRAVHIACTLWYDNYLRVLVEAKAEINARDKFGRLPIHFAASAEWEDCLTYLLETFKDMDINVPDHDGWTPLMWAARSGNEDSVYSLVSRGADVWARGRGSSADDEWSALKLANFRDLPEFHKAHLAPNRPSAAVDKNGDKWNEYAHKSRVGDAKSVVCKGCLVNIRGIQWECIDCPNQYSLCFKCYGPVSFLHDTEHNFVDRGPVYREDTPRDQTPEAASEDEEDGSPRGSAPSDATESTRPAPSDEDDENLDTVDYDADDDDGD